MHRFKFPLLALLLAFISACDSESSPDCFQKAGEFTVIERTYNGNLDRLFIEDRIEVILVDDDESKIVVSGPKNLLPEIETEVIGDDLYVRNANTCNWVRDLDQPLLVAIHGTPPIIEYSGVSPLRSINQLRMPYLEINCRNGAGDIAIDFKGDSIRINLHVGTAAAKIEGECSTAFLFNQGVNVLDASALAATNTFINNSSQNDIFGTASDYLFCSIDNTGNVLVTGAPEQVDLNNNGPGTLTLLD